MSINIDTAMIALAASFADAAQAWEAETEDHNPGAMVAMCRRAERLAKAGKLEEVEQVMDDALIASGGPLAPDAQAIWQAIDLAVELDMDGTHAHDAGQLGFASTTLLAAARAALAAAEDGKGFDFCEFIERVATDGHTDDDDLEALVDALLAAGHHEATQMARKFIGL